MKEIKGMTERMLGRSDNPVVSATTPKPIVMYSTRFCPYCIRARSLLQSKGWDYHDIRVDGDQELRSEMMQKSGEHSVPQIWIGDQHIGGCDELFRLEKDNRLIAMVLGENQ